ncbi:hypothetical protein H6G76_20605 [Nostoc sp. FACHB-152]|uniref:hypothetical protein n=1 Tax=unclassified Nostoc TaxID=2593658 RepID=UPI0016849D13|nr:MULTISPECIES: hypothetical protein [unclassified Nostoc]MBD2449521.1 hypothetical protein [Nostoc sp. FACHB-152]MBD2470262.1 hypothetical protein [Nostoc sp. FACHB-145]
MDFLTFSSLSDDLFNNNLFDIEESSSSTDTFDLFTGSSINTQIVGTAESSITINTNDSYNKTIITGDGNDYISAGLGNDTITAGSGSDTFAFNSPFEGVDTITDFSIQQDDKLQISGAGFGIGKNDFNRFTYDPATGGFYFDTTQLATLPLNLSFEQTTNIIIV